VNRATQAIILWTIAIVGIGCGGSSKTGKTESAYPWETFHAAVEKRQSSVSTLSGDGRLSVETTYLAESGSFTFARKKTDSLVIRIQGPFGIKVGALQLAGDSLRFYSALENRLAIGTADPENLERILRMRVTAEDLIDLLTGGGTLRQDRSQPDSVFMRDGFTVLAYASDVFTRWYAVDDKGNLRSIQMLNERGTLILEQTYDDFRAVGSMTLPYQLRTIRPVERQRITLRFHELSLNDAVDITFAVPSSAEVVRWR